MICQIQDLPVPYICVLPDGHDPPCKDKDGWTCLTDKVTQDEARQGLSAEDLRQEFRDELNDLKGE